MGIIQRITVFFKRNRDHSAQIEKKLSVDAMLKVRQEAAFLRDVHGVEVRHLKRGEKPSEPKLKDPEEAR